MTSRPQSPRQNNAAPRLPAFIDRMRLSNKIERNLAIIVLVGAVVIATSVAITRSTLHSAIEEDATIMAQGWADYLARTLPDIEAIAEGTAPSMQSSRVLNLSKEVGSVFRYKIFSRSGHLALISDDPEYALSGNANLDNHNPTAADVIASGTPYIQIKEGNGNTRPPFYGEAYVPLMRDGRAVATVEVYVDLTDHRAAMEKAFRFLVLKILGGLALAFAIPAGAFALLSREQADVINRLDHASHHDGLTGVMNRAAFSKRISALIGEKTPFAVHYLDLDRFKGVNDTLGHSTGDVLLREVAARLIKTTGSDSFVGRLGGDEFAVCQKTDSASVAHRFAEHLVRTLSKPYLIHGHEILIGGSIGFARYPENGDRDLDVAAGSRHRTLQGKKERPRPGPWVP
jgi:diguanylate cyclase (GGDEF)-like protein